MTEWAGAVTAALGMVQNLRRLFYRHVRLRWAVMKRFFSHFARWTEREAGRAHTFAVALAFILIWAATGPFFGFSNTWQLVINTGTTIVTFLMVFLIQHSQNRDTQAMQLKLDELIRVNRSARNSLLDLEEMSEEELMGLKDAFCQIAKKRGKPELALTAQD
jgi:low affinity Fe/Cu permease